MLKVRIQIKYEKELEVFLKILFVKIKLFPRQKKKKKAKEKPKKNQSKPKAKRSSTPKEQEPEVKVPLLDNIKIITDIVKLFFKRFSKHLHVKIAKIHISVATGNAASTAILYGVVAQAVAYLVEALDCVTNLDRLPQKSIIVETNYIEEKPKASIDLTFSIRIIGMLDSGVKSLLRFLKLTSKAKSREAKKQGITLNKK